MTQTLSQAQISPLVALFSAGKFQDAIAQARHLIGQFPDAHQLHNLQGAAYAGLQRFEEALHSYHRSLVLKPDYTEAHNNLGSTLLKMGRPKDAIEAFGNALQINPRHPESLANLGATQCALGLYKDATHTLKDAVAVNPRNAAAFNNLGAALFACGRQAEAIEAYEQALALAPQYPEALNNLGNALNEQGRHEEAITRYRAALAADPNFANAHGNLGSALYSLGRYRQAVESGRKALELDPNSANACNTLGLALYAEGQHRQAIDAYNKALQINPKHPSAMTNLGDAHTGLGRRDDAMTCFSAVLARHPDHAEAHHKLAGLKTFSANDPQIDGMRQLYDRPNLPDKKKVFMGFALGKACEDIGAFDDAFLYYSEANRLRKAQFGYDAQRDRDLFARIKSAFGPDCQVPLQPRSGVRITAQTPIFIVGMPRSGTTLVEQILASHSQVHGGGELAHLSEIIMGHPWRLPFNDMSQFEDTARSYRAALQRIGAPEAMITDKMPLNFRWIGFIRLAMPDAKIIHVKRDARATCWSIFKHLFGANIDNYVNDLNDITKFYRLYVDLMEFWEKTFPNQIHHIDYEKLTEDQATQTRSLIDHVGLQWEDQCIDFQTANRVVTTVSADQVRQQMYTGSSEAWRKFEALLGPMIAQLDGL